MARHAPTSHRAVKKPKEKKVRKKSPARWRKGVGWSLVVAGVCVIAAALLVTTFYVVPPMPGTSLLLVGGALLFTGAAISPVNYGPEN